MFYVFIIFFVLFVYIRALTHWSTREFVTPMLLGVAHLGKTCYFRYCRCCLVVHMVHISEERCCILNSNRTWEKREALCQDARCRRFCGVRVYLC